MLTEDIEQADEDAVLRHHLCLLGLDALVRPAHHPLEHGRVHSLSEGVPGVPGLLHRQENRHLASSFQAPACVPSQPTRHDTHV